MPKVLPEYLLLRKEQILDAAAACFARRGFHQTTMQDICDEAELSPGALYRYFRSKEELIEEMGSRASSANAGMIQDAMALDDTATVFDALSEAFFGAFADEARNPSICALNVEVIAEAPRNERIRTMLTARNEEIRSLFREIVERGQARGEIDPGLDAGAVAVAMVALYHGFITQKLVEPELDTATYAEVVRALFHGGFWREATARTKERSQPAAIVLRH